MVVRREVKAAIQLIEWLRARRKSLATCTQHDIDDWLATDIWVRYLRKLTALGIKARPARNTTLMDLSAELPAVVLSRLLGLHISRAEKWTKEAGSTRADYAAEFSRRGADAHT
ncbi:MULTISPECIES: hypothetical protein [unclassified Streptomyces]|uniref:hypothetical protein n=1 Tax=unclassified Streptomyces TaxID=2593676 RepID=UPI0004BD01E5|nr:MULTISPECIES: hypothetical protein [unclassified Streptomyces]